MYPIDAISIHTPLAGSDGTSLRAALLQQISIHTPLAGSDYWWFRAFRPSRNFNPHSPCGERHNPHCCLGRLKYFNPHSPCGERPSPFPVLDAECISIHTPLAGSDRQREHTDRCGEISIHTPLAGSDACRIDLGRFRRDFNPHSPCGERRAGRCRVRCFRCYFNPHSPCGERLPRLNIISPLYPISIHTPLAGSD